MCFWQATTCPRGLPPAFHIAELGFGTGLNLLAAWRAWEEAGHTTPLRFTSFEAFPMTPDDMARALEAFPAITPWADRFLAKWSGMAAPVIWALLQVNVDPW